MNIYILEDTLHQNTESYIIGSKSYNSQLVKRQKLLYRLYYPLIKLDRLSGNYFLFDNNIPNMGG